jgi:predicted permease
VNSEGAGKAGARLRGFTGVLAGGLVVLVLALLAAWAVAERVGTPGPGLNTLVWHGAAAVAAVLAQRRADRRRGAPGVWAAVAVLVITAVLLTVQWLV